jgi:hypothetical protein
LNVSEPSEIRVNLPFRGRQLAEFLAIKEHLGIQTNADVVRYLVHRHARALQRRKDASDRLWSAAQRRRDTSDRLRSAARGKEGAEGVPRGGRRAPDPGAGQRRLEDLCLNCPLPECDEGDPRCPYQQATGAREQQRARTRAYMRRARAE